MPPASPIDFRRDVLVRLPLPLAQLYSRAFNAKDSRARHDNAFYLFEATVKLSAAPAIACYLQDLSHGIGRVPALDRLLLQLALPSFGQWVAILRELSRHFGERPDAASHPLGRLWQQLSAKRRDRSGLLGLYRRIKHGPDGRPSADDACSLLDVIEALVQYRNTVFGHGGPRLAEFFDREMGPLLLPAVNDLFDDETYQLLGPRGSRLVYLTDVRVLNDREVEVGLRELVGRDSERMTPLLLSTDEAKHVAPNRVGILWPGQRVPWRLDPLLIFRESETAEEVLFLNRDRNQRHVEYLSYSSGRTERDRSTVPEMCRMLSTLAGREVIVADLQRLAEQSISETPSLDLIAPESPLVGQQQGDYEILVEIGRGGMGVVYLARQLSLGRIVALKMLPTDLAGDPVALARFRREIQHLAGCDHPNIVKVLASGTLPDGRMYYTMEYVPGCDLELVWQELGGSVEAGFSTTGLGQTTWSKAVLSASRKRREGAGDETTHGDRPGSARAARAVLLPPLPELPSSRDDPGGYIRRVCELMRDAALALQAVHDQKLVHRDIKPANLMLTPDGARIVLMDFGLVKGESLALTASRSAGFLGTLRYAAPEQMASAAIKVGPQADVHGLGCVMWELFTGKRLFGECEDGAALAAKVLHSDLPRLRTIDPGFDRDLDAIVARSTERRTEDRIASAAQLADYLQLALDGKPIPIRTATSGELFVRWCRQNKLASSLLVAVALLLLIGTIGGTSLGIIATRNARRATAASLESADNAQRASEARDRAERALERAKTLLYSSHINSAVREWEAGEAAAAQRQLEACQPERRGWEHRYLNSIVRMNVVTLTGHEGEIWSVAFSPDGKRLVSGSGDKSVRIWDTSNGKEINTLEGHTSDLSSLSFNPAGNRIVSGSSDGTARIWDAESGKMLIEFKGNPQGVQSASFSPDGKSVVSAGDNEVINVWDAATGANIRTLTAPYNSVYAVAFSPDGSRIASAGFDKDVTIWNVADGRILRSLKGHTEGIVSIAFSPDGKRILSGSEDFTVRMWDVASGKSLLTLNGHTKWISGVAFSPDGRRIASGGWDHTLRVWDASNGRQIHRFDSGVATPLCVSFSRDGKQVVCGTFRGTLRFWDTTSAQAIRQFPAHRGSADSLAWSGDSGTIVSAGADQALKAWNASDGSPLRTSSTQTAPTLCQSCSANGQHVLSVGADGKVVEWNLASGQETHRFQLGAGVRCAQLGTDGRLLLCGRTGGALEAWDAASGRRSHSFQGDSHEISCVACSSDGKLFASGSDRSLLVWNADDGSRVHTLNGHSQSICCAAFNAEGTKVVSGCEDGSFKVWDLRSGREAATCEGHSGSVNTAAFSSGGDRIVSGGDDTTLKIWDVITGHEIIALKGHTAPIKFASFSPDGKRIASADMEGSVRIWGASGPSP